MAWIAVDKDKSVWIFQEKPKRINKSWSENFTQIVEVNKESCKKLTGKVLTWEDEPIEI